MAPVTWIWPGVPEQTRQRLANVEAILKAGCDSRLPRSPGMTAGALT